MRARLLTLAAFVAVAVPAAPAGAHNRVSPGCSTHACAQRVCRDACKARHARAAMRSSIASWYGPGLYGNRLGCGGTLTPGTVGVAHKSLPCGTRLRMCAARCATLAVVDRGPYVAGREFDLTAAARSAIGAGALGVVRWRVAR